MSNKQYTLEDVVDELSNIEQAILIDQKNDFGYTIGDELHEIKFFLKSISESLEIIANK
jgi:hypothetical protein